MTTRLQNAVRRILKSPGFWVVTIVLGITGGVNFLSETGQFGQRFISAQEPLPDEKIKKTVKMREGTQLVDTVGRFQIVGENVTFSVGGKASDSMNCLPNLMLQRIYQSVRDDDRGSDWIIQGRVTEYFDSNFLVIERATRAPRATKK